MNRGKSGAPGGLQGPGSSEASPELQPRSSNSSYVDGSAVRAASGWRIDVEPQKQKRVACKQCRQAKLRCLTVSNDSGACARCRRVGIGQDCQIDVNYKRVNKRAKINELAEQVEQLRYAVGSGKTGGSTLSMAQSGVSHAALLSPSHLVVQSPHAPQDGRVAECDERKSFEASPEGHGQMSSAFTPDSDHRQSSRTVNSLQAFPNPYSGAPADFPRSLEHISIKAVQINALFQRYFACYHPFLAVLDPSLSPDEYYVRSPVLFWTIISVAARRYEDEPSLLASLSSHVMKLLWNSISTPPYSRYTVQAIVLICVWPFPTSSLWTEPSFMLVSNAKSASMQLGLHRPEIIQDFSRSKRRLAPAELEEAARIWSACYIAAESITSTLGQFPLFNVDWTIDRVCDGVYSVPEELRHHLLIQRFSTRVSQVMSESRDGPTGQSTGSGLSIPMALLEDDFVRLDNELGGNLTAINDIVLACACLKLQIFYFWGAPGTDFRKRGLLRAYSTGLSLIKKVLEADTKSDLIRYATHYISSMTFIAAVILFKIANSSYSQYIDLDHCKLTYNSALSLVRRASVEDNDLQGKSTKMMTQIWSVHNTLSRDEEPSLSVKTRAGAGVLHDILAFWRGKFGGPTPGYQTPTYSTSRVDITRESSGVLSANEAEPTNDFEVNLQDMNWIWDMEMPLLSDL